MVLSRKKKTKPPTFSAYLRRAENFRERDWIVQGIAQLFGLQNSSEGVQTDIIQAEKSGEFQKGD